MRVFFSLSELEGESVTIMRLITAPNFPPRTVEKGGGEGKHVLKVITPGDERGFPLPCPLGGKVCQKVKENFFREENL